MLTRDQILAAKDRTSKEIDIEEWGGQVVLTALNVRDRAAVESEFVRLGSLPSGDAARVNGLRDLQVRLVAYCITDESGVQLFSQDDVAALSEKSPAVIGRLADEAVLLNGLAAKAEDDAAKN